jgi:sulfite reductase beta subunit-like hemoprotein
MESPPCAAQLIHISGCAKGCAHPGAAALTVVGTERGCGIVHAGSARAVPSSHVDPAHIVAEIEHIFSKTKEAADA